MMRLQHLARWLDKRGMPLERIGLALVVVCSLGLSGQVWADNEVTITKVSVADNLHMLMGQGGNIGVLTGADGTFLIDDQFAPLSGKIQTAIRDLGGESPRFLINTHFHGDHTGGNENFGSAGTLIFSHDNVRERLSKESYLKAFKMRRPAQPKIALPVVTFAEGVTFHLNGLTVDAVHIPNAHTDGDSFIHFREVNVIHAGDIFFNGFYPFIDADHGGTLQGMIDACDRILALADERTKIIPGHGPLADRAQLLAYREMLKTAHARLSQLKAQGKSAQEAVAAKPLADLEATWGKGMFSGDRWIEVIYAAVD